MKRFKIILILAVAFIMLFAGNVCADDDNDDIFTEEDMELVKSLIHISEVEVSYSGRSRFLLRYIY